jgi:hypothetical protein
VGSDAGNISPRVGECARLVARITGELRRDRAFKSRMTGTLIVGVYESRSDAERARSHLIERGVAADRIHIEHQDAAVGDASGGTKLNDGTPRDDRSVSGFIAKMFSGALLDDAEVAQYKQAVERGHAVLVVQTGDNDESDVTRSIVTGASVRSYSLPNAPTAWREATANDPPSIGDYRDRDPARPEGLLEDAEGFSVDADRKARTNAQRSR